jgi:diadenosine tetraphosphatase ApaH/serine/threonine PP2A family protein phosphatase
VHTRAVGEATAILYDVHGNLVALEAVLAEAEAAGAGRFVLGGDYATFGPWPLETVDLLDGLPAIVRIRGNVDRWLRETPEVPDEMRPMVDHARADAIESLGPERVARLAGLHATDGLDGILVCHGSPLSDIQTFASESEPGEARLLGGRTGGTILFGHSHVQFERPGPDGTRLINPGSVGAPLDGDTRAAWALYEGGEIRFRRTRYDVARAAAAMRSRGSWAAPIARRIERASG